MEHLLCSTVVGNKNTKMNYHKKILVFKQHWANGGCKLFLNKVLKFFLHGKFFFPAAKEVFLPCPSLILRGYSALIILCLCLFYSHQLNDQILFRVLSLYSSLKVSSSFTYGKHFITSLQSGKIYLVLIRHQAPGQIQRKVVEKKYESILRTPLKFLVSQNLQTWKQSLIIQYDKPQNIEAGVSGLSPYSIKG